jgi:hypothetical protein
MQSSHIPWKWKWHTCTDFGIIIAETRRACVIAIIWLDRKVGREQDGLKG